MTLHQVLTRLHEPNSLEVLQPYWEDSVASAPAGAAPFLREKRIREALVWAGLQPEAEPPLLEAALRVRNDPRLSLLAWHLNQLLFEHLDYDLLARWPTLEGALGELSGPFYLLVVLDMIPRARPVLQALGAPDEVIRETLAQLRPMTDRFAQMHGGRLGITLNTIYWLRHYVAGRLLRVGRFEYMIRPFHGALEVYRNRQTGATVALSAEGRLFDAQGYVAYQDEHDAPTTWTATLDRSGRTVTGYPISPFGHALRRPVTLSLDSWTRVLRKDDPILEMHIPGGGGMTLERCGDSMRRGVALFGRLFPEQPFAAIASVSWIFNPQLEQIPLSSGNLVRFQRELYLYPWPSSGTDGLWFIFLQEPFDLETAPRETSLQRGVASFIAAGNRWRSGGMFYLVEDLPRFGTQPYRAGGFRGPGL